MKDGVSDKLDRIIDHFKKDITDDARGETGDAVYAILMQVAKHDDLVGQPLPWSEASEHQKTMLRILRNIRRENLFHVLDMKRDFEVAHHIASGRKQRAVYAHSILTKQSAPAATAKRDKSPEARKLRGEMHRRANLAKLAQLAKAKVQAKRRRPTRNMNPHIRSLKERARAAYTR